MNIKLGLKAAKTAVTSKVGRQILVVQKHSPVILFAAGTVGAVTSTVLACKATLRYDVTTEPFDVKADLIREAWALGERPDGVPFDGKDAKHDLFVLKVQRSVEVCKLYAPALVLGTLSFCALGGSHLILSRRNAGLMAAYAALDQGYKQYRGRVAAEYGEEKERELRLGLVDREETTIDENGKEVTKTVKGATDAPGTFYARKFDRTCDSWKPGQEYNQFFIRGVQTFANDTLQARGHVMLNDVYDDLGMTRTKAGAMTGWVKDNPKGDGYIDFGISNGFITDEDGGILLDFNVDGVVLDLI